MKAHKVTLLIVDFEQVGDELKSVIENTNYPGDCITPRVMEIQTVDIGKWEDSHPLNRRDTQQEMFKELFKNQ